ncbi:pinin/SDK/memA/ protein conserved region-domain-containing protein [Lasiosphaeria ovina]|uniref:Pinin/SDK/memA/ protein conserved region-domain-containing protein n=1 Tax=Lasiosphaeria ovina TaxID=92902 RepID=A0AAE0TSS6_9PEZI|nr:pinin/SDK/memA/ protein conserved region-domain-containing protein [Lasiosphaeria ovina]
MLDQVETASQKRKASPAPPTDDEALKRVKVEASDGVALPRDASHSHDSNGVDQASGGTISPAGVPSKQQEPLEAARGGRPGDMGEPALRSKPMTQRPLAPPAAAAAAVRRNISQEEKKRGQRLFGGLLSTLSQTTSSSQHKKRLEMDRRQHEKVQHKRAEDDRRRAEKLAKLNRVRKIAQVEFDEQVMRTRHSSMMTAARSLRTRTEPRLHYRPWQLTADDERTIEKQIRAAEETVEREKQEFRRSKERRLDELGVPRPPPSQQPETSVGEPTPLQDTNRHALALPSRVHAGDKDTDDTGDDLMDQDKEDTVLY